MSPGQSFTIPEWCVTRRVSRSMFYKLRKQGRAPRTHSAGAKQLISPEADAAWLAEREAEAAANPITTWAQGLADADHDTTA
jgi:predicted DNA-binding transcriptional regulator AlpA